MKVEDKGSPHQLAVRNRCQHLAGDPLHKRLMIIFFIPFGSVIYFFMVKINDFDLEGVAARFRRPPSVGTLRAEYKRTPSLSRLIELAEGLTAADPDPSFCASITDCRPLESMVLVSSSRIRYRR